MPMDQANHDLVVDAIAATKYADDLARMHASGEERRMAELDAAKKHRTVHHLNINHAMNHGAQAAKHQARYAALTRNAR